MKAKIRHTETQQPSTTGHGGGRPGSGRPRRPIETTEIERPVLYETTRQPWVDAVLATAESGKAIRITGRTKDSIRGSLLSRIRADKLPLRVHVKADSDGAAIAWAERKEPAQ